MERRASKVELTVLACVYLASPASSHVGAFVARMEAYCGLSKRHFLVAAWNPTPRGFPIRVAVLELHLPNDFAKITRRR